MTSLQYFSINSISTLLPFALLLIIPATLARENCPEPWVEYLDYCYLFERGSAQQHKAATTSCADHNALLLSIDTTEVDNFVTTQLNKIADKAVFASNLKWFTSGDAVKGTWGTNAAIKDKKYLPGAASKTGDKIVYAKVGEKWGWDRVSGEESHPFICQIKREDVHNIIVDDRDYSYGIPIRDFIQQQYRYFHAPHFEDMPKDQIFDEDSLRVNERPGAGLKLIQNSHARLHCRADGYPFPDYEWWKQVDEETTVEIDGKYWQKLDIEANVRLTLTNGLLLINSPSRTSDAGTYFCSASNKYGTARSNQVTLNFGYLKDFTEEREQIGVREYDRLVIPCQPPNFFPAISYKWYKDYLPNAVDLQNRRIFSSRRGNLYIAKAELPDSGDYYCQVKNVLSDQGTIQVSKHIPVKVEADVANQRAPQIEENFPAIFPGNPTAGMNVSFECVAYGDPVPTYKWEREGSFIPSKAIYSSFNRILMLPNIQPFDDGSYKCIAINNKGTSERSLSVSVTVKPYFDIEMNDVHVDTGKQLSLTCTGTGLPEPEITWWKNGVNIAENKPDVIARMDLTNRLVISPDRRTFTVKNIQPTDKGTIQCRAKNVHGEAWSSSEVRVLSIAPTFEKHPMNLKQVIVVEQSAIIVCNPEASPKATFKWFKNGSPLPDSNILKNGNYRVPKVSRADDGEYTCRAQNNLGTAESKGRLVVVEKTRIPTDSGPRNTILQLKAKQQIECEAIADRELDLTYEWSKNGVLIDAENDRHFSVDYVNAPNKLLIIDAGFSQNGNYSCIAKTTVDEVTSDASITVHGPPGAPGGITIKRVVNTDIDIQWTPAADNGETIQTYDVEAKTQEDERWRVVRAGVPGNLGGNSVGSATIRDLSPGAAYSFRVVAFNKIGRGGESMASAWVQTNPGKPTKKPTNVRGSGGKVGNLQIQWDPLRPEDENGVGIGYIVRFKAQDDSSGSFIQPDTWDGEIRIKGRTGMYVASVGTQNFYKRYDVMVTAFNELGEGPDSELVTVMSAENTPQVAPRRIKAIGYNGTAVKVTWNAVPNTREDIRGELIGYKVNYWPKDYCRGQETIQGRPCSDYGEKMALHAVFKGQVTQAIIIGLDPMTEYTVNAMVFNSAGNGPKSDDFNCQTLKNAPLEPPTYVKIFNLDNDSIKVTWRGVVVDTILEEPVWGYKVRIWDASMHMKEARDFLSKGSETEMDIHMLKKDVQYNLRVLAFSQGGDGRQSSPILRFVMVNGRVTAESSMMLRGSAERVGSNCLLFAYVAMISVWRYYS